MNNEQNDFDVKVEYRKQGMTLIGSYKHIHDARKFSGYNEVDAVELFKKLLVNKYIQQAISIKNLVDSEEVIVKQLKERNKMNYKHINTKDIKLMIIENFIDNFTSDEKERKKMKIYALEFVHEDHVDEIAQSLEYLTD